MTTSTDDGLFDPEYHSPYKKGDRVVVSTIWGEEGGNVARSYVARDWPQGYPMLEINLDRGDTITINIARVEHEEESHDVPEG